MRPSPSLLILCVLTCSAPAPGEPALRGLTVDRNVCWAVGDAGTILRSHDGGLHWQRLQPPVAANFQSVAVTDAGVYFFGGRAVPGHPAGQGVAVLLRTTDGGKTFEAMPAGPAGWLYGGTFAKRTGVLFGQANYAAPGGVLHTTTAGRHWAPASLYSKGFVLGGDFRTPAYGYLVGQDHRIVSLRGLAEPRYHPPRIASELALRGIRFADENVCWCVGDNAAAFRSRPAGRPWDPIALGLPPGARRCADLEAIAFTSRKRAWLAGGLIGVLCHTDTGGGRWQLLPAPGPGAIHAIAPFADETLLAAGDGGRIWRSTDAGKSWRLIRGTDHTDVLFIAAAGETSIYPALVAHALAGLSVAVVYATHLPPGGGTPPDQPLRAAAALAGADAITTLTEFPSIAASPSAGGLSADDVLHQWSARLDIPAAGEMVRQLAAAIRLHRPLVLAVGPDGGDRRGCAAENRLVARLAQNAAAVAARADALKDLARAGLKPHAVRRIFVGLEGNARWSAPWQQPPPIPRKGVAVGLDAAKFPGGRRTPISLLAQTAVWRLPARGLIDRPADYSAYRCAAVDRPVRLFTTALSDGRLLLSPGRAVERNLATSALLTMAIAHRQTYAAAIDLIATLDRADTPETAALAADRLLLAWWRLLDEGQLIKADTVLAAFLKKGRHHPLSQKMDVLGLAAALSAEWNAQLRARGLPKKLETSTLDRAVAAFPAWPAWSLSPAGRMLHAKALAALGHVPKARAVLRKLAADNYPAHWRRCARLELADVSRAREILAGRRHTAARFITGRGKLDGRLDEPSWKAAPLVLLLPASGRPDKKLPAGSVQVVRSAGGFVILGVRLPAATGRQWDLDVAIDADRDAWTQIVLHCDTRDARSARLLFRHGPAADLGKRLFQARATKTETEYTFEIAAALGEFSVRPPVADVWNFQVRATAHDLAGETTLYFQPQPDRRLLPERYGLLRIPGAAGRPRADGPPAGRPRKPRTTDPRFQR